MIILGAFLGAVALFFVGLFAVLYKYKAFAIQEPLPEPIIPPKPAPEPVPVPEPPKPLPMPEKTKREHLYEVAKDIALAPVKRDMSPLDRAPDRLACVESLDGVFFEAFGEHLFTPADRLSTARAYAAMRVDPRLELIKNEGALPGDVVVSPSGMSTKGAPHGHTGIRGKTTYMSNDSDTGKWLANYNLNNWKLVFQDTLGFPIFHFRVKGTIV